MIPLGVAVQGQTNGTLNPMITMDFQKKTVQEQTSIPRVSPTDIPPGPSKLWLRDLFSQRRRCCGQ